MIGNGNGRSNGGPRPVVDVTDKSPLDILNNPPPSPWGGAPSRESVESDSVELLVARLTSLGCTDEAVLAAVRHWARTRLTVLDVESALSAADAPLRRWGGIVRSNTAGKGQILRLADDLATLGLDAAGVRCVLEVDAPKMVRRGGDGFERDAPSPAWLAQISMEATAPRVVDPTPPPPVSVPNGGRGAGIARGKGGPIHEDPEFLTRLHVRLEDARRHGWDPLAAAVAALREHHQHKHMMVDRILHETQQVTIYQGAENLYEIHLKNEGRDAAIRLTEEEFVSKPLKFRQAYLRVYHEVLRISNQDWDQLTAAWMDPARTLIVEGREEASEELLAVEAVLDRIRRCHPVDNLSASTQNDDYVYWDPDGPRVVILSEKLQRFLRAANPKVQIERLGHVLRLKNVTTRGSHKRRVDGYPTRFWDLDPAAFGWTAEDVRHIERETIPPLPPPMPGEPAAGTTERAGSSAEPAARDDAAGEDGDEDDSAGSGVRWS